MVGLIPLYLVNARCLAFQHVFLYHSSAQNCLIEKKKEKNV